nr:reverse transcriptase domain-containing protein [Tanacetum cinerariifolium]
MRTRSRSRSRSRNNSPQQKASPAIVEPLRIELLSLKDQFQEDTPPESPMADNRTMAELLQAPTEGYEDAIVIPEITVNNFELKHGLINLSSDVAELKDMVRALLLDKKNQSPAPTPSTTPAPVKAVESNCVTCGVPSQMTYPVASLTLDSARSYVMQGASFTQGTISSIPISGSISPEGFWPSILLMVIMVTVVIIVVILVVVIVLIVGVVIVVAIIGVVVVVMIIEGTILIGQEPFQFSPGDLVGLLYSNRFDIGIPPGQGILGESTSSKFHFKVLDAVAMRKYRFNSCKPMNEANSSFSTIEVERLAAHKLLKILESKTSRDSHGDNGMRDPIGGLVSLGSKV